MTTQPVNEQVLQRLAGNTRSQAIAQNDAGRLSDEVALEHLQLQLRRPPEQEAAIEALLQAQQDPASPSYHQWLTAAEIGTRFGPAQEDIAVVTDWLTSHGFRVNSLYPNGMTIDFSGTAGAIHTAFHTEMHRLNVSGQQHISNMTDPMIPAALAPVVEGVVSMNDFMPRAMSKARRQYTFTSGGSTEHAVAPADLATIYNLNPLFNAGITGKGQTIVVVEDSDMYNNADWTVFRNTFGLASYTSGTLTTVHPAPASGTNNCLDPGVNSDDVETELDAEWASAAAPNAAIVVATCANSRTTFGGLIAIQNLLTKAPLPQIISVSYGECEAENGAAANAAYNTTFQTASLAGVSVFVAAGDEGSASCDAGATGATHGIGVSGFASTPNNIAVGGTDFSDTYSGTTAQFWNTTNTSTYGSAKSYIPETPWNDSCAGSLLSLHFGYSTPYGSTGFCNSTTATQDGFLTVGGGSGGPSGCATGSPSTSGVVSGTCKPYTKPSWQTGFGDSVRDIPDVSLFAANGLWGHYYPICYSDRRNGGVSCSGAPSTWAGAGGTSFASPIMGGIQALVNQYTGNTKGVGNPATTYYGLATGKYPVFNAVTLGDNTVNCSGTVNCYGATTSSGGHNRFNPATPNGALSTSTTTFAPAYPAGSPYSFATGLGSVNAYNLAFYWNSVAH
jgi:subtilase family serine protease